LNFYDTLFERIKTIPGVISVGATTNPPGLGAIDRRVEIDGRPEEVVSEAPQVSFVVQTNDYLSTIGLPILRGEGFDDFVQEGGVKVAIATNKFAQHFWPEESASGKRFRFFEKGEPDPWMTVVGVSADLEQDPSESDFRPIVFLPHQQKPRGGLAIIIRTSGDAKALARPVRRIVQELDQDLPLFEAWTLQEAIKRQFWFLSVFGTLFLSFALIGLVIASVGIYGVIAQSTAQRTQEIGIRMALGASAGKVLKLMLARGLIQMGVGLFLGLIGAVAANTLLSDLTLGDVSPRDPLVLMSVATIIMTVGLIACWIPAEKAARMEPSAALRID
jgi:predicted permease